MSATWLRVLRAEGAASAFRRARERLQEAGRLRQLLGRGVLSTADTAPLLNVSMVPPQRRLGGVPIQMQSRLDVERELRTVAWLYPGILEHSSPVPHARLARPFAPTRRLADPAFANALQDALDRTSARAIHLEGTWGVPLETVVQFAEQGLSVILGLHDVSLYVPWAHLGDPSQSESATPREELEARRAVARRLLRSAAAITVPSVFLRDQIRQLFDLPGLAATVIAPGLPEAPEVARSAIHRKTAGEARAVAFAGSVKPHKGGRLLPEIIGGAGRDRASWHVFGGGDEKLLRPLRRQKGVRVHGYYGAGGLPRLLTRHAIDLVVLPSIVPESFGLTLSESWQAGVPVVALDQGAFGERIAREGGGWLVPPEHGAAGIAAAIVRWMDGERLPEVPSTIPTSRDAANAHLALYRRLESALV